MNTKPFNSSFSASEKVPAFFEYIGNKVHYNKGETFVDANDRIRYF